MGLSVNIISQKYFNQFKNGVNFTDNVGDYTNNLTGSVFETVKVTYLVDIDWYGSVTSSDVWNADTSAQFITRSSGNWFNDGFSVGDTANWFQGAAHTAVIEITSISQDGTILFYNIISGFINDSNYAHLHGITPLTAINYHFGLIGNTENYSISSKVSQNDQGYYGSSIGYDTGGGVRSTAFVNLTELGQYKDWITGSMRVRYVNNPTIDIQRFEVEHIFTIVPFYLDGQLNNLKNNITPNILSGSNSLKYVFSPGFRTVLSNQNTEKTDKIQNNLGSISWFNENFNGFQNNYNVVSIDYIDANTLAGADGILATSKTKVTIEVERISGNFVGAERFGAYVSYLPKQSEYTDLTTDLKDNFLFDSVFNNSGLAATNGNDFITNCTSNIVGGNLIIEFDVEYSLQQQGFLSNSISLNQTNFLI